MSWNPLSWFGDLENPAQAGAQVGAAVGGAQTALNSWLSSTAGDLASGLEGAMVSILGDVWDVIVGPLEIITGAIIIFLVLSWAFKNQLITIAMLVAK
jgi:hypothetical protein